MVVLGVLGRYPLSLICKERAVNFWIKIKRNPESLINKVYLDQWGIEDIPNNRTNNLWVNTIKSVLDNLGYSYIFDNFDFNIDYLPSLKQLLRDQFVQNWRETITNMSKLDYYCKFKTTFKFEEYLSFITNDKPKQKYIVCLGQPDPT